MSKIRILQDDVINKIAAGEVVERPASVLKEIVENAVDAGATVVDVELLEGGMKLISVKDNGSGIPAKEIPLAFTRHATSKIQNAEDLFDMNTNGFRGEALASIAAVSKVTLQSRTENEKTGARVVISDEVKLHVQDWSGPKGTHIFVEELFYNIPARRNFLKAASTEFAQCHELMQALCVCFPKVHFRMKHNEKSILDIPAQKIAGEDLGEDCYRNRAKALIKGDTLERLNYACHETEWGRVEMLLSPPGFEKPTGRHIYSFVNGRFVKDKLLRMGVMRGYHSHLLKGKYPVCVLRLTVDPSLVDVNVHPAKTELRFQYGSEVQSLIAVGIKQNMRCGAWAADGQLEGFKPREETPSFIPPRDFSAEQRRPTTSFSSRPSASYSRPMSSERQMNTSAPVDVPQSGSSIDYSAVSGGEMVDDRKEIDWTNLKYVGSFQRCYLFFEAQDGLLSVDQHAFHERVLYERYLNDKSLVAAKQSLLVPEEIILSATDKDILLQNEQDLATCGFEWLDVEGGVELKAVPAVLSRRNPQTLIEELIEKMRNGADAKESTESLYHIIVATYACHAAVRAGEELGQDELSYLLSEAPTVDFYHNCPHGRPVFKWFSNRQVENWFERT